MDAMIKTLLYGDQPLLNINHILMITQANVDLKKNNKSIQNFSSKMALKEQMQRCFHFIQAKRTTRC
jgi:hypothetical protein